jgi:hypothetical protein
MVLVKNIDYLYSHYEIAARVSLSQDEIYGIAETLTSLITQNRLSLKEATRFCEEKLGLQRGDSLTIARHLLATRQWLVNMNIPIEPGNQMALYAV